MVIVLVVIVTVVLLLYPRASSDSTQPLTEDVDNLFIGRTVLIVFFSVCLAGGGIVILITHCAEPIRAQRIAKKPRVVY